MTARSYDTVIVGGGAMGLAAAWQLTLAGQRPLVLERFGPGHRNGASHGATRNYNDAYHEPHYLALLDESLPRWRELEEQSGATLLRLGGLVTHGDPEEVGRAFSALSQRQVPVEMLSRAEAGRRFRGMRFDGEALLSHNAGVIAAEDALRALAECAAAGGAEIRTGARVTGIEERPDGVRITLGDADGGERRIDAGHAIVTAGAWTEDLVGARFALPELVVTEEQPAHFQVSDPGAVWPSFNHFLPADADDPFAGNVYGMCTPGEGVKVGFHRVGPVVHPDARSFRPVPELTAELRRYVSEWFPGLDPDRFAEVSCTYTNTPDGRFVLDGSERITVGAGFSGHGFKFVPTIGRILADAARGVAAPPSAFALPRR